MPTDPIALTPEERALAQRLARLGPHGEPSPALDARILAAAHDAMAQLPARRSQRRWPVAFGVAASLALAIGIALQLRPLPDAMPAYRSEAPVAMRQPAAAPSAVAASDADADAGMASPAAATQVAEAAPAMPAPEISAARSAAAAPSPATKPEPVESPPAMPSPAPPPASRQRAVEPNIVFDSPAPAAQSAAAAANEAAPRAFSDTSPMQPAATASRSSDKRAAPTASAADQANAAAALPETDTLDRLQAGGAHEAASDEPGSDVPPATMASPEVRDAWLARIRELVAAGKVDSARASLREFMRRYPDYALPEDLRALGQ